MQLDVNSAIIYNAMSIKLDYLLPFKILIIVLSDVKSR